MRYPVTGWREVTVTRTSHLASMRMAWPDVVARAASLPAIVAPHGPSDPAAFPAAEPASGTASANRTAAATAGARFIASVREGALGLAEMGRQRREHGVCDLRLLVHELVHAARIERQEAAPGGRGHRGRARPSIEEGQLTEEVAR